ncbi:MAG: hypothetical protein JWR19_2444 [Pedosphaera sp.]|nr:hypothetical protein [Pedosphaera sp.]
MLRRLIASPVGWKWGVRPNSKAPSPWFSRENGTQPSTAKPTGINPFALRPGVGADLNEALARVFAPAARECFGFSRHAGKIQVEQDNSDYSQCDCEGFDLDHFRLRIESALRIKTVSICSYYTSTKDKLVVWQGLPNTKLNKVPYY